MPHSDSNDLDSPQNLYGYVPTSAAAYTYIILFSITALAHLFQTYRSRLWWTIAFFICALGEICGWVGRYYGSTNEKEDVNAFLDQEALILSPNFTMGGLYAIFSLIVTRIGTDYAIMRPWMYPAVFITFDVVSLVIQAIGGGMAAVALQDNKDATNGTWIMFGGVVFQFCCLVIFVCLALNYAFRVSKVVNFDKIGGLFRWLCLGMAISTTALLVRAIYRAIELAEGWTGYLMTHEAYFVFLDALPTFISLISINLVHPLFTLPSAIEQNPEDKEHKISPI